MNKKFFTLIAGLLMLAASLGTATAQYAKGAALSTPADISESLPKIGDPLDKYYQLGVSGGSAANGLRVLTMVDAGNGQYQLQIETAVNVDLPSSLWKIRVSSNNEGSYSYYFVNVGTGLPLTYSTRAGIDISGSASPTLSPTDPSANLGGEVSLWKWQRHLNPENQYGAVALTSSFASSDSTAVLIASSIGPNQPVYIAKYSEGDVPVWSSSSFRRIFLTPYNAAPVMLTVDDLNSMLWSQDEETGKVSFSFKPDVNANTKPNLFTSAYKARADASKFIGK